MKYFWALTTQFIIYFALKKRTLPFQFSKIRINPLTKYFLDIYIYNKKVQHPLDDQQYPHILNRMSTLTLRYLIVNASALKVRILNENWQTPHYTVTKKTLKLKYTHERCEYFYVILY